MQVCIQLENLFYLIKSRTYLFNQDPKSDRKCQPLTGNVKPLILNDFKLTFFDQIDKLQPGRFRHFETGQDIICQEIFLKRGIDKNNDK